MTRCRWTDRIADTVADPAGGVGALTAEEHAHIGRCAECFSTVERLVHLDRALTGDLRSLERGELPRSLLATPAYERRSRPAVLPGVYSRMSTAWRRASIRDPSCPHRASPSRQRLASAAANS